MRLAGRRKEKENAEKRKNGGGRVNAGARRSTSGLGDVNWRSAYNTRKDFFRWRVTDTGKTMRAVLPHR